MKRICKICQKVVTDDKLLLCPACKSGLFPLDEDSSLGVPPEVVDRIVSSVWRRVLHGLVGSVSLLTIIGIIGYFLAMHRAYQRGISEVEKEISRRVEAEFRTERIRATVESAARDRASVILASNVMPIVESFTNQTAAYLADAARQIAEIESKTQSRTVTPQLRDAVTAALRNAPRGDVVIAAFQSDQEAVNFGQISTVLSEAGLSSRFEATVTMNTSETGIGFCVQTPEHPPEFAVRLHSAFRL